MPDRSARGQIIAARLGMGLLGMAALLAIAILFSTNRRAIRPRVVGAALGLQILIAGLVLRTPWGREVIAALSSAVTGLLGYARAGTLFVFGPIASPEIGAGSFAIAALPTIIFFASVISILYHLRVMPFLIRWVGGGIRRVTGITRVESLSAAANIFVGQSESPLVVGPYLAALTPSQLFLTMSVGMAGVAGTMLGAYASLIGAHLLPYLLAASFMSAPGGIAMAKIMVPDDPVTPDVDPVSAPEEMDGGARAENIIMAAAEGAQTGVKVAVAVGAMMLAFVALIALANGLLGMAAGLFGYPDLSFQAILGMVFRPILWLIGVPWDEAGRAGALFGAKLVVNEFVAFVDLSHMQGTLSPATVAITTFTLCGFANFASIAIQMAVVGNLAPNQRPVIARFGLRAVLAGSLANLMSGALAGLMLAL